MLLEGREICQNSAEHLCRGESLGSNRVSSTKTCRTKTLILTFSNHKYSYYSIYWLVSCKISNMGESDPLSHMILNLDWSYGKRHQLDKQKLK